MDTDTDIRIRTCKHIAKYRHYAGKMAQVLRDSMLISKTKNTLKNYRKYY